MRAHNSVRERAGRLRTPRWVLLSAALLLLLAIPAAASVIQSGNLRVTVLAQVEPPNLPRDIPAPIAVFISGHIGTVDGTVPPQLQTMTVKVNRHGLLQSKGLPVCHQSEIHPGSTERALAECSDALVGSGRFWATVVFPDQRPYPTRGRLLIFNGRENSCATSGADAAQASSLTGAGSTPHGPSSTFPSPTGRLWPSSSRTQEGKGGERTSVRDPNLTDRGQRDAKCHSRPVLLAHIFTRQPFVSSFVVSFALKHISEGPYGTELSASLPQALGDWGFVDRIKLTLKRKYRYEGKELSYFNAACPAPNGTDAASFPLALASFDFAGGEEISATVVKACRVKE
jgi:hypothetical protein